MSKDMAGILEEKFYECNRHMEKIQDAKEYLKHLMPLTIDQYNTLSKVESSFIDQLNYRFSKLQDSMGEGIFKSIILLSGENVKKMTFIDILNRLEELEVVNKNKWLKLRETRNAIAHEYSFNVEEVVDNINLIYIKSDDIIDIYKKIYLFVNKKFNIKIENK